ncbi:MAG: hypothetical protein QXF31_03315 [Candidatus Bathyarchaeia archaeon]
MLNFKEREAIQEDREISSAFNEHATPAPQADVLILARLRVHLIMNYPDFRVADPVGFEPTISGFLHRGLDAHQIHLLQKL